MPIPLAVLFVVIFTDVTALMLSGHIIAREAKCFARNLNFVELLSNVDVLWTFSYVVDREWSPPFLILAHP